MNNNRLTIVLLVAACALLASGTVSDKSPVINPGSTVTFSYQIPVISQNPPERNPKDDDDDDDEEEIEREDTDEVFVLGSFLKDNNFLKRGLGLPVNRTPKGEMKEVKDNNGDVVSFTYTSPELPSNMYTYCFEVDGRKIPDPLNPLRVRDIADTLSYFIIPGGLGDLFMDRDVPHGRMTKVWYPSRIPGMSERRMTVYLPPRYDAGNERYPVLYLLHGSGGDEDSWGDCGRAAQILDNMIAAGRCKPMIVVMPNGNVNLAAAPGADPKHPDVQPKANNMTSMLGTIEWAFMDDVAGYVDKHYRTIADKQHRAIAGLSLGGLHTRFISMNNPQAFDYVGLFSAQATNAIDRLDKNRAGGLGALIDDFKTGFSGIGKKLGNVSSEHLDIYQNVEEKMKKQFSPAPKLFYIALGKDDFVKKLNDDLRLQMSEAGYRYTYRKTEGGHTWDNWREYLVDFLPRLFK